MEPPSYEEATLRAHAPPYQVPSEAPPSYEETITVQPDPVRAFGPTPHTSQVIIHQSAVVSVQPDQFPVLRTPTVTTTHTSHVIVHQPTVVGTGRHQRQQRRAAPPQVVVTQPQRQQTVSISRLGENPGYVRCSKCQQEVTTVKALIPSSWAFFWCFMVILGCFWCGCCLIPFCIPSCWNVYHFCPRCRKRLHIFTRYYGR
ncbi:uncharacterized protein LOC144021164 [Festucalex cinctus]